MIILSGFSLFIFSILLVFDLYAIYLYRQFAYLKQSFVQKKNENTSLQKQLVSNKKWTEATEAILMKAVRKSQEKRSQLEMQRNDLLEKNEAIKTKNDKLMTIAAIHSHKIRQPTASILGLCSIINIDTLTDENKHYFEMIEQLALKLDEIIHEVVSYSNDDD